jgi:hypothetical protein
MERRRVGDDRVAPSRPSVEYVPVPYRAGQASRK